MSLVCMIRDEKQAVRYGNTYIVRFGETENGEQEMEWK